MERWFLTVTLCAMIASLQGGEQKADAERKIEVHAGTAKVWVGPGKELHPAIHGVLDFCPSRISLYFKDHRSTWASLRRDCMIGKGDTLEAALRNRRDTQDAVRQRTGRWLAAGAVTTATTMLMLAYLCLPASENDSAGGDGFVRFVTVLAALLGTSTYTLLKLLPSYMQEWWRSRQVDGLVGQANLPGYYDRVQRSWWLQGVAISQPFEPHLKSLVKALYQKLWKDEYVRDLGLVVEQTEAFDERGLAGANAFKELQNFFAPTALTPQQVGVTLEPETPLRAKLRGLLEATLRDQNDSQGPGWQDVGVHVDLSSIPLVSQYGLKGPFWYLWDDVRNGVRDGGAFMYHKIRRDLPAWWRRHAAQNRPLAGGWPAGDPPVPERNL